MSESNLLHDNDEQRQDRSKGHERWSDRGRPALDPAGTIRRDNPREQGAIGLAQAIAWFTRNGYEVSLPISEAQRYDLIVEDEHGDLKKVEVKTTTYRDRRGRFVVQIATSGGNQSWTGTVKRFDPDEVDILYVLTDEQEEYVIPTEHIRARTALTLGTEMAPFCRARRGRAEEQLRLG